MQLTEKGVDESPLMVYTLSAKGGCAAMKIHIEQDDSFTEPEITIKCNAVDPNLDRLISSIRLFANTISGKKDNATYFISLSDVFYFETTDNKMFFYTADDVYETNLKLYEVEERFSNTSFVRVSKSFIVNLRKVASIQTETNGRLIAQLVNREKIVISRQYVAQIREKLGVGGS